MLQNKSLDFKLVQRICLLQKALDQAMASVSALQDKVSAYDLLESQLVQTEEYANVQEKIISNLQQKLAQAARWRSEVLQPMVGHLADLVDDQQLELEHVRLRIQQGQQDVQAYLKQLTTDKEGWLALEVTAGSEVGAVQALAVQLSSELQAAQWHIQQIDQVLSHQQVGCVRVQAQVGRGPEPLEDGASTTTATPNTAMLQAVVHVQQQRIQQLQAELGQQRQCCAQLHRRCQDLAAEQDHSRQEMANQHPVRALLTPTETASAPPVLHPRPRWHKQMPELWPDRTL